MLACKQLGLKHSSAVAQCKSSLVGKQKKAKNRSGMAVTQKGEGKLARYIEIVEKTVHSKYMRDRLIFFT